MFNDIMCVHRTLPYFRILSHCNIYWQTRSTLVYQKNRADQRIDAPISESLSVTR